jgi:2-polyprenyl-3-methyl-5-hydroxy-6-metoxy-1,4-benzoquinol methylase
MLNDPMLLRPDKLPVAYCCSCGLWYVCALPPEAEIRKLYQGYWYSFRPVDLSESAANSLLQYKDLLAQDIRLQRLAALSKGFAGKRILDVGCGRGALLVAARRRGAEVFGNDISAEACTFVRDYLQIPVYEGCISEYECRLKLGLMDIVVMSDVFEHLTTPIKSFQAALDMLVPGGLLLILTPNGGAAGSELCDAICWEGFRVDLEHLQYFSAKTILKLAREHCCQVEHLESFGYAGLTGIDHLPTVKCEREETLVIRTIKNILRVRFPSYFELLRTMRQGFNSWRRPEADLQAGIYTLLSILRKSSSTQRS